MSVSNGIFFSLVLVLDFLDWLDEKEKELIEKSDRQINYSFKYDHQKSIQGQNLTFIC